MVNAEEDGSPEWHAFHVSDRGVPKEEPNPEASQKADGGIDAFAGLDG